MSRSVLCLLFQAIGLLSSYAQETVAIAAGTEDSISRLIHLTSTPFIKEGKILLQWNTIAKNGFYIVERSDDSKRFEVIGVLKARPQEHGYEFMDEKPLVKRNYYRIKIQGSDDSCSYSYIIAAGITDSIFCKFYPNPVDKLLILKSPYSLILRITDITGRTRIEQQVKPGLAMVDVSSLEKNLYIITIFHEESNQIITNKLIKN